MQDLWNEAFVYLNYLEGINGGGEECVVQGVGDGGRRIGDRDKDNLIGGGGEEYGESGIWGEFSFFFVFYLF